MGRGLTTEEGIELAAVQSNVAAIVAAGSLQALTATGILNGWGDDPLDYDDFHQRFSQLLKRLKELTKAEKIVVDDTLPATMGANAATGTDDSGKLYARIDVRAEFVSAANPVSRTVRAIDLMHEVAHTLLEKDTFPVRDYTYRHTWAQGCLARAVGTENADTYAEAAARLAETIEEKPPGYYREIGRVPAQREALRAMPSITVGPALAWADIVINRAWLRAEDYRDFGKRVDGTVAWSNLVKEWERDPSAQSMLYGIETSLRERKVIGERVGTLKVTLSDDDRVTTDALAAFFSGIKDALKRLQPILLPVGADLVYDAGADELRIPYGLAATPPLDLGNLIARTLVAASAVPGKLASFKGTLVDLLTTHDRPQERSQVLGIAGQIKEMPAVAPTAADWSRAQVGLDLAALDGLAALWRKFALVAGEPAGLSTQKVEEYRIGLPRSVAVALKALHRLSGQETPADAKRRAGAVRAMMDALVPISARSVNQQPGLSTHYGALAAGLAPYS
ncbi:hypothetical protein [Nonomuraea sediminis]|uniref:hypothetical protein n=1 Tax=Nonomuraea sediminis TaxID=2835864 RepID=UPI001BDDC216|nr:hypothetical protein [Nonomuraea sediminis]